MSVSRILWAAALMASGGLFVAVTTSAGCSGDEDTTGAAGAGAATNTGVGGGLGAFGGTGGQACGPDDPNCKDGCVGAECVPPNDFPLPWEPGAPDNVTADGVTKDDNGWIVLDSTRTQFNFLWVADDFNYNVGFVSKVQTERFSSPPYYREVGRYVSVTCFSDEDHGSKEGAVLGQTPPANLCANGVDGCCARDASGDGAGPAVQLLENRPSRTTVDLNGDLFVANRAHNGGGYPQASVTKIANDIDDCIDRNGNGVKDTSSDVNNDGIITTDCNGDNQPDDFDTVCSTGIDKEFYGLDDECILSTTNIGPPGAIGRPLALGPDPDRPTGPSDAWAGSYQNVVFYRIDGLTGQVESSVVMAQQGGVAPHPYGAAIDQFGILWAPNVGEGNLFYFDTNDPNNQGMVSFPGGSFYGIALDGYAEPIPDDDGLIQQVWLGDVWGSGSGAYRYRPVRDGTFAGLGQGTWAHAVFDAPSTLGPWPRGRGLGADNRQPVSFVWVALDGYQTGTGRIGKIPIDIADGATSLITDSDTFDTTQQITTGAGVAFDRDVWGVNQNSHSVVHFSVDDSGNVVDGPHLNPAEHVIPLDDKPSAAANFCGFANCKPQPYTYSDFTGFGLRNFTNPQGYYAWIETGECSAGQTRFLRVLWDSHEPQGTNITMRARAADVLADLPAATWTGQYDDSPADLAVAPGPLDPNPTNHIEVMFELTTTTDASPALKAFAVEYTCEGIPD
ncbi:MAG: hypothetical protein JRI23_20735 [Deltaproteobacteria bacterium]|jgi:hypothetical protein|nr:hypothetical protein [Deltaproteobacteria bacterium]MBW2534331.1 hypothetical protein [Deltaproteobacteria bacterium]